MDFLVVVIGDLLVEALVSIMLGSLAVNGVQLEGVVSVTMLAEEKGKGAYATGLELAVDEGTGQTSKDLLGLSVASWLAVLRTVILICLGSLDVVQQSILQ
jgi:hypothetical protein